MPRPAPDRPARDRGPEAPQQLSLFDLPPMPDALPYPRDAMAPLVEPPVAPCPDDAPYARRQPPTGREPAGAHIEDKAPATTTPARFDHARADRQVQLGEHRVGYAFRRARRRSIGFSIGPEGLSVAAPRWVSVAEVEQALKAKAGWILRKLHEQHERSSRLQANRIDWRDGTTLPFLGETVIVLLDPRVAGSVLHTADDTLPGVPRLTLHVGLPQTASQSQIREAVQSWLQRQARRIFEERCAHFAPQLGVQVRRLALSSAATRWGSASADGSVRLHWRLVHFALPVIDYVVTHELAHLREMNHSPAFWDVVRSVLPDFEHHRVRLRTEALPAFD